MEIKNICVHHQAGTLTFEQVNELHKSKWPEAPSELLPNTWVGYNFIINKDGSWKQFRYIGEETCAQKGHNFDTVSICLQGNFTKGIEFPTYAQQRKLTWFIQTLVNKTSDLPILAIKPSTVITINQSNIFPHRIMQPNHTECFGNALSDDWARVLVFPPSTSQSIQPVQQLNQISIMQKLILLYQELIARKKSGLGGVHNCWDDVRG